jgi:hypothetical protein
MGNTQDRRDFWRAPFRAPAHLTDSTGASWDVRLRDISLKGALVELAAGWSGSQGDQCRIRLDLAPDATISMVATVAHIDGIRVGLRCDEIDIDSITHLRRLVELNAGDESLLERELAALLRTA